jgi:PIN domain nuclease of toxin-antitoxin system
MRLLLDTHVLLWWHDQPAPLTETAYSAINDLSNDVSLSVVNGWEIQIKAQLGKLTLPKREHQKPGGTTYTSGFEIREFLGFVHWRTEFAPNF